MALIHSMLASLKGAEGRTKGTVNRTNGTDNRTKGTDDRSKGTDDRNSGLDCEVVNPLVLPLPPSTHLVALEGGVTQVAWMAA